MATLKLKPQAATRRAAEARPGRPPVRGSGSAPRPRPSQAQAQAARDDRRPPTGGDDRRRPPPDPRRGPPPEHRRDLPPDPRRGPPDDRRASPPDRPRGPRPDAPPERPADPWRDRPATAADSARRGAGPSGTRTERAAQPTADRGPARGPGSGFDGPRGAVRGDRPGEPHGTRRDEAPGNGRNDPRARSRHDADDDRQRERPGGWQGDARGGAKGGDSPDRRDEAHRDGRRQPNDDARRRDAVGAGRGGASGPSMRDGHPPLPARDDRRPAAPGRRAAPPDAPRQPGRAGADARAEPRPPAPRQHRGRPATSGVFQHRHDDRDSRDDDDNDSAAHVSVPGSLRLSKRMSQLGMASRREADEWIAQGWVRVDDQVVSQLGSRVLPEQRITIDARAKFQQAQKVTVLLNKPVGWVSGQAEDGYEPAVVLVTPQNQWREDHSGTRFLREHLRSLVPAGRLDIDSVGLLVLTQDGRVAKQLVGEHGEIEKEYLVRVATLDGQPLPDAGLQRLRHGIELDGEALREAVVEWLNDDQLRFVLKEGKKRQIRRMCEAVGLRVLGLKRVRIGQVMLGDLPVGQWRYLRADESFG